MAHRFPIVSNPEDPECPICCESYKDHQASRLPCLHVFGSRCIQQWLLESNTCPVCREPALIGPHADRNRTSPPPRPPASELIRRYTQGPLLSALRSTITYRQQEETSSRQSTRENFARPPPGYRSPGRITIREGMIPLRSNQYRPGMHNGRRQFFPASEYRELMNVDLSLWTTSALERLQARIFREKENSESAISQEDLDKLHRRVRRAAYGNWHENFEEDDTFPNYQEFLTVPPGIRRPTPRGPMSASELSDSEYRWIFGHERDHHASSRVVGNGSSSPPARQSRVSLHLTTTNIGSSSYSTREAEPNIPVTEGNRLSRHHHSAGQADHEHSRGYTPDSERTIVGGIYNTSQNPSRSSSNHHDGHRPVTRSLTRQGDAATTRSSPHASPFRNYESHSGTTHPSHASSRSNAPRLTRSTLQAIPEESSVHDRSSRRRNAADNSRGSLSSLEGLHISRSNTRR